MSESANMTIEQKKAAVEELIQRMLNYDKKAPSYDGYPTTTCHDDGLIHLVAEIMSQDSIVALCFLASEHCTTREHLENARRYINAYIENTWQCNMSEGSNEVYAEVTEEEWQKDQAASA